MERTSNSTFFIKEVKMVGDNTLIINQAEMTRAVNMYLNNLMMTTHSGLGNCEAVSVRQKGAPLKNEFIIEIKDQNVRQPTVPARRG
jgi:hypothetical protein